MSTITEKEWRAKGEELFGPDQKDWKFVCPRCGLVMSQVSMFEAHPKLGGTKWTVYSECVGRYVEGAGCDWAAYGLFRGPVIVIADGDDIEIPAFDFEGKPLTGDAP